MASSRYSYSVDLEDLNTSHSLAILSVRPGSRVLDIGAADGSVARVLAGRGCRVSAVERDEVAARQAALVCEHVATGDIENLDLDEAFAGQRFDAVLLLDVLEHLREPLDVLKRAAAVLVPDGQIIASIPNVAHGAVRLALLRGSFEYTETGLLDRTHLRFFDRPAIEELFRAAGLHIRDCLRVTRGLTETEIPIDPQAFLPAVVNEVAQDPESTTYQFVIVAVPTDESGTAGGGDSLAVRLQQRLLATERRFREVEAHARSVAQELDARSKALDEARTTVVTLEGRFREVEAHAGSVAQELDARSKALDEARTTVVTLEGRVREVEAYARSVAQELDARSKALDEERTKVVTLEGRVREVEADARSVAQELDARSKALEEIEAYARSVAQELDTRSKALDEARTRFAALEAGTEDSRLHIEELTSELVQGRGILAAPSVRLVMEISARLGRFPRLRGSVRRLVRFVSDRTLPSTTRVPRAGQPRLPSSARHEDERATEPLAEELQRLQSELARVQADAQRRTHEAAALQRSAAWAFVLRCHEWRARLIPPHSRREGVYKRVLGAPSRSTRPGSRQPPDPPPPPPRRRDEGPVSPEAQATKDTFARLWQSELSSFLATGHTLRLPRHEQPLLSIVVVVYNRADLTFQCLRSLAVNADVAFELIVVDNASSDETVALLDRVDPVTVIRNDTNLHFLRGCNQAARVARGEYLLFLNSDACLLPGSLAAAVRTMSSSPDVGTVGAKLVLLDGTLQEAGSIVWGDGSCLGYGRGDSPLAPPYMFQRDVSYSSGAFLLTRRDLFAGEGGFDERFAPAYYEEVDYCMRLWQAGKRSVYDPQVVAYHFEFGSSASPDSAIELQRLNRSQFAEKHAPALASLPPGDSPVIAARSAHDRRRVLMIDDRVPHEALGSGFPRARAILQSMVSEGFRVTFYPMTTAEESWPSVYQDIPRTVEVILSSGVEGLEAFLHERHGYYDVILVSRPHNMEVFRRVWGAHPEWLSNTRVVYDAEAIFALREIARREVLGKALPASEAERLIAAEVDLARGADTLVCVTGREAAFFSRRGAPNVVVLGHAVDVRPTLADFADRAHLLFIGAIHEDGSPNADSLLWFADQVLPRIREALAGVELYVAGINASAAVARLAGRGVRLLGPVDDLEPVYGARRLFVAPTRFSAGLPIKVCEAAARGLPVVATPLLASQLGWHPGRDLLVGDTAAGFADACIGLYRDRVRWQEVRANALKQVETHCSRAAFSAVVAGLCADGPLVRSSAAARASGGSGL